MGKTTTAKIPVFLSGQPAGARRRAPLPGERTSEILRELGCEDNQIRELLENGTVLETRA